MEINGFLDSPLSSSISGFAHAYLHKGFSGYTILRGQILKPEMFITNQK